MRIHILSDLHLEFAPFQPSEVDADVIVLAGDIHTGKNGIKWILKTIPDRPVIYSLGNHEFYGQKIPKLIDEIKEVAQGTNVHVLENESVEIGNVVFLGATLLHAVIFMGLYVLLDLRHFGTPYAAVAGQAVANAVVGVVAFQIVELLPGAVERRRTAKSRLRR